MPTKIQVKEQTRSRLAVWRGKRAKYTLTAFDIIICSNLAAVLREDIFVAAARREFEYIIKNYLLKSCI